MKSFFATLGCFSRIPVPASAHGAWRAGMAAWLPIVGIVVGAAAGGAAWGAGVIFPPWIAGCLGTLVWVVLTGGLHLDGVADCGDGLGAAVTPERRLEIMKDPRLGSFGALALGAVVLLKASALAALVLGHDPARLLGAVALAAAFGRWQIILAVRTQALARPGGMGETFAKTIRPFELWVALLPVLALAAWARWRGLACLGAGMVVFFWLTHLARRRLGGVTGDVFGALVESTEVVVLLVCCAEFK